ncbi:peroxiredoxin-like family protein [Amantichitinum ursilacus]|uniref:thioredoxin-dependent peroxiredoxin n=1 Tax=Amantichitinum ursilacus TaxID=857265 RepID=A0A0N0XKV4_9NEIS|nr:peroxiredoxin-like family protein [Amantichitinum ursilacus]KPC55016.1 thioredoxin-dependent thiol peroxidase [Amantichitinum ursilacus]
MNTPVTPQLAPQASTDNASLQQLLADLHAQRVATWAPEDLAVNVNQRATLVAQHNRAATAQIGDVLPDFSVQEVNGELVSLDELTATGPAVLVFFRFAGCPACNIALPYYQRALQPALQQLGIPLLALSPQRSDRLVEIKQRHQFDFRVATDRDNALARHLGILYEFDQASRDAATAKGNPIGDVTGTGTWELPKPTVLVVDQHKTIRYIDVAPDWLLRTEAEPIIQAAAAAR